MTETTATETPRVRARKTVTAVEPATVETPAVTKPKAKRKSKPKNMMGGTKVVKVKVKAERKKASPKPARKRKPARKSKPKVARKPKLELSGRNHPAPELKHDSERTWAYNFSEQEVINSFGRNLFDARTQAGLTQAQLAAEMNYTRIAICNMERGKNGATLPTLLRLCVVLKTEPTALLRKRH